MICALFCTHTARHLFLKMWVQSKDMDNLSRCITEWKMQDVAIPCGSVVRTRLFHCRRWVQSLVRELRSHKPLCLAKKKKKKKPRYKRGWTVTLIMSTAFPPKIKNRLIIWPSNFASGCIPKRTESKVLKRYVYTPMFIVALFTIAQKWKQPN